MNCDYCHEPITKLDPPSSHVRYHRECEIRVFVGSVTHQQKRCRCFGGGEEEPEFDSPREGARAAYRFFTEQFVPANRVVSPKQMPLDATFYGCRHPEAYCLMHYRSEDGLTEEWIWNSRDGLTPFYVVSRDGRELRHVEWRRDRFLPQHVPGVGSRVFVDLTREIAEPLAASQVERFWDDPEYPMSSYFDSKEGAAAALLSEWLRNPGAPHLTEVTPDLRLQLLRRPRPQFQTVKGKI